MTGFLLTPLKASERNTSPVPESSDLCVTLTLCNVIQVTCQCTSHVTDGEIALKKKSVQGELEISPTGKLVILPDTGVLSIQIPKFTWLTRIQHTNKKDPSFYSIPLKKSNSIIYWTFLNRYYGNHLALIFPFGINLPHEVWL